MRYQLRCTRHLRTRCDYCPRPRRGSRLEYGGSYAPYDGNGILAAHLYGHVIDELFENVTEVAIESYESPIEDFVEDVVERVPEGYGSYDCGSSYGGGDFGGGDW